MSTFPNHQDNVQWAKELGVDVPKEITAKTKEANQYIKEAKAKIK